MADAFNCTVPELKKELASLISSSKIQARIDSHKKILKAKEQNEQRDAYQSTLKVTVDYQLTAKIMIMRAKLVKADLVVRPESGQNTSPFTAG